MRINIGIWILAMFLPVLDGCSHNKIKIDIWYGDSQSFGSPGNPQRAINILGNICSDHPINKLEYSLNGKAFHPLSMGADGRRLARDGDFNVEIYRYLLNEGMNDLLIQAIDSIGNKTERRVSIRYTGKETWPLPYNLDWQKKETSGNSNGISQEEVYLMDGKWRLENGRIRTVEPYYDRVLAFGDSTWEDYEVRTDVIFYGHSKPEPGPPTFGVAHVAMGDTEGLRIMNGTGKLSWESFIRWLPAWKPSMSQFAGIRLNSGTQNCRSLVHGIWWGSRKMRPCFPDLSCSCRTIPM
jgi:hypothetical protein